MQTLFTSDRMIVEGEIREGGCAMTPDGKGGTPSENIYLKFVFQVNGKLTQYVFSTVLEKEESRTTLKNWHGWNSICELFSVMGYQFEERLTPGYNIINTWIQEIKIRPNYLNN